MWRCAALFVSALLLVFAGSGIAQTNSDSSLAAPSAVALSRDLNLSQPRRAFPQVHLFGGRDLLYLGMFSPDAAFRSASKLTGLMGYSPGEGILPASGRVPQAPSDEVPPWMLLQDERVVESFIPPRHAAAIARLPSKIGEARNRVVTYAYGRPSVLRAPRYVVTDSQQRLIISDPDGAGVHVLDPVGKSSFRITSGKGQRLLQPAGVAVDADDNIYVADASRGMVIVFDRSGNFLREVGTYRGEPDYARPEGISIDRAAGHIYLIDSPRNLLVMLDLEGHKLKTFGRLRNGAGSGELNDPTEVVVNDERVFVLDESGGRVNIMDTECHLLGSFNIARSSNPRVSRASGLAVDSEGNVYVSSVLGSVIRTFSLSGRALATFGQRGRRAGELEDPKGLWIDSANRLYVADSGNGRVQMFQLRATP